MEKSQARTPIAEAMQAGPAHRAFIETLPEEWKNDPEIEIFSRMLWLKPGWYPLSPHYHLDWYTGREGPKVETMMVLLGGGSRTEFVSGIIDLPDEEPREGGAPGRGGPGMMPRSWGKRVADGVRTGQLKTDFLEPEQLVLFDNHSWHRASPAESAGWRVLIRAIRNRPKDAVMGGDGREPNRFTTARNNYIPETAEEVAAYAPYQL